MPASAPSADTFDALVRLGGGASDLEDEAMTKKPEITESLVVDLIAIGGGALDLWLYFYTISDENGLVRCLPSDVADRLGRTIRWFQRAVAALRDANLIEGGLYLWLIKGGE